MFRKLLSILFLHVCLVAVVSADPAWFGIYMQGTKIGYSMTDEVVKGDGLKQSKAETLIKTALLGSDLDIHIATESTLEGGSLKTLRYVTTSNGRTQTVLANRIGDTIEVSVDNGGSTTRKVIQISKGQKVVDDPSALVNEAMKPGATLDVWVLDPTTVSLIKNTISNRGKQKTEIRGVPAEATWIEVKDPRSNTHIYFNETGDVIKIEAPLGMILLPEPKEMALDMSQAGRPDLATATALITTPKIESSWSVRELKLKITGVDITSFPRDAGQIIDGNVITVKPLSDESRGAVTINEAALLQPEWIKPSLLISSEDSTIVQLSKATVGAEKNVMSAARLISKKVQSLMRTNCGIGVLRDAKEVLATKEGVCRDYAILAAALMRASQIPTRLTSGLIYDEDRFYYHAWVEVFNGTTWVPLDPTRADREFDATHIKIAQGQVEDAFVFKVLDGAKINVIEVRR